MELKKMKPLMDEEAESPPETGARKRRNPFNTQRLKEEKERRQKKRARLIVRNISYKSTEGLGAEWGSNPPGKLTLNSELLRPRDPATPARTADCVARLACDSNTITSENVCGSLTKC